MFSPGLPLLLALLNPAPGLPLHSWPLSHRPPAALSHHSLGPAAPLARPPEVIPPSETPALQRLRIPVTFNGAVRHWLSFFQGRGRPIYAGWYARMGAFAPMMLPILEQEGLPPELIYICMIESGFQTRAVSRAQAVGPWQFIYRTAGAVGLRHDAYVDERQDPYAATVAAARYFKMLYERFGDWPLVLAAYNAGEGAVGRAIRKANSNDYWVLSERGVLPVEATRYVPKAMAAIAIGQQPERYGFENLRPHEPWRFTEVNVPGGSDLRRLAARVQMSAEQLRDLNPQLRRGITPPGPEYPLRVPPEHEEALRASLNRSPAHVPALSEYRVRFGEYLWDIAKAHGTSTTQLRQLNNLPAGEPEAGGMLLVPQGISRDPLQDELLVATLPSLHVEQPGLSPVYFPVRRLMPVSQVAAFFGTSPGMIALWNALDPSVPLQRGMVLRLFVPDSFDRGSAQLVSPDRVLVVEAGSEAAQNALSHAQRPRKAAGHRVRHKVAKGETLLSIARRYRVTVDALRAENGLKAQASLAAGSQIWVPTSAAPKAAPKPKKRAPAKKRATAAKKRAPAKKRAATTKKPASAKKRAPAKKR